MAAESDISQVSERAQYLFKCLVERYINDGQPVGSRTLAREARLNLSPATIRNVMADLEDLGLVSSPHTSAGRVPTVKGYRLFVDSIMTVRSPGSEDIERLAAQLLPDEDMPHLLTRTSSLLAEMTQFAGLVTLPRHDYRALRQVEFLPLNDQRVLAILVFSDADVQNRVITTDRPYSPSELTQAANFLNSAFAGKDLRTVQKDLLAEMQRTHAELNSMMQAVIDVTQKAFRDDENADYVLSGQTRLMEVSELSDIEKLRHLFDAFNQKRDILHLLDQSLAADGVQIFIGEESGYEVLDDCSVITAPYEIDGEMIGVLGVIGPTRMEYERVIPLVDLTAKLLGSALKAQK